MDEPFSALDPITREQLQAELITLHKKLKKTIVFVTHDIDEAFRLGQRVGVMSQGRLLQYDRPTQLITQPADPFVSQLIGTGERSLRLLSLTAASELSEPGACNGPAMPSSASLREVLAELVWSGASSANLREPGGAVTGHITLESILAHGRRGP